MANLAKAAPLESWHAVLCRERSDGLYRVITYLCAKMVEELGMALLTSLAFSALVFFTLKLQARSKLPG